MNIFGNTSSITIVNGVVINGNQSNIKKGNGKLKSEKRIISNFDSILIKGSVNIFYQPSPNPELTIECEENLLDIIETTVQNGVLYIQSNESFSTNLPITIKCGSPKIKEVNVSGSGNVTLENINEKELLLSVKGSGDIDVEGTCHSLTASVSGSGDIDAEDLTAQNVVVSVSGSGDAVVRAKESVKASVSGSGSIKVKGKPQHKQISESGSGRVKIK